MKVSVVTVSLNAEDTITDTLESVSSQTYPRIEHIVIDGGSSDGTVEILSAHQENLSQWISTPDNGIYHAMNKGIQRATGDIIGFLNADDVYQHDEVITEIARCFEDQSIQACYADLVYVDRDDLSKVLRYWRSQPYRPGLFEKGWMPAHPTFFVRRNVYERFGGFNETLKYQSDFELTARMLAIHRVNARYLPEIIVRMRAGGTTNKSVKNIVRGNIESYRACRQLGLKLTPLYFVTKFMMRAPQFFNRPREHQKSNKNRIDLFP